MDHLKIDVLQKIGSIHVVKSLMCCGNCIHQIDCEKSVLACRDWKWDGLIFNSEHITGRSKKTP